VTHDEKTWRSADGLTLYYRDFASEAGDATPIVCLPGLTRNSRDFIKLATHLSQTRRVICPDLRGRGFSDRDPNYLNYRPPTYVNDIFVLLERKRLSRIIVIGTSLGGLMAMIMAALKPDLLAGVILNDVGPEIAPQGLERILQYVGRQPPVASWDEAVAQAKETYGATLPGMSDAAWAAFARRGYREDETGRIRLDFDPGIGEAAREAGATLDDPWALFAALKPIPTLALRGAISDILSTDTFSRMAEIRPDLMRATIPHRGHVPLLDERESLAAIDEFLSRIP
jgi:pimeloyl-ACP methyl ester carboxylesterase